MRPTRSERAASASAGRAAAGARGRDVGLARRPGRPRSSLPRAPDSILSGEAAADEDVAVVVGVAGNDAPGLSVEGDDGAVSGD